VSVYMAFYAGAEQRGRALSFLDTTNHLGGQAGHLKARAIWIEGSGDGRRAGGAHLAAGSSSPSFFFSGSTDGFRPRNFT
jgi:hypothetical protein